MPAAGDPIRTRRLDLVVLTRPWLLAQLDGGPAPDLGFADPDRFLAGSEFVARLRADQIAAYPGQQPWLLRAIVLRESGAAVGYTNFHAPPDERGMVEIGYQLLARHRRRGYATEAADAMYAWAGEHGALVLRASVAPDNAASIAMVTRAGFERIGEQVDEVDGLELVFERPAPAPSGP